MTMKPLTSRRNGYSSTLKLRNLCLFLLGTFFFTPSFAQNKEEIYIFQKVVNSFTRMGIGNALVTITDAEGTLIDTLRTRVEPKDLKGSYSTPVDRKPTIFHIKVEHPDYETTEMEVKMDPKRKQSFTMPEALLKLKPEERELGEAVVKATRVQICYKGDTIEVNARAFKLPEGSMLDGLVQNVPGCELSDNGDIYMNGKKVDYLTLNGQDFFKGNNRIMLDNLPYFTVDKLQFYNKDTDDKGMMGKKDYVMNVKLKKEYSIGYLGNVEAAGGTHERWLGRAFGVRFTDNSRLTLFANANNVNENRKPGNNTGFGGSATPIGDTKLYNVGGDLMVNDKYGRYKENINFNINHRKSINETRTASESFLPSGTAFGRNQNWNKSHGFDIKVNNDLELKRIGLIFYTDFDYSKNKGDNWMRTGQFSKSPADYGNTVTVLDSLFSPTANLLHLNAVNRTRQSANSYLRRWGFNNGMTFNKDLANGDRIYTGFGGGYWNAKDRMNDLYQQDILTSDQPATEQQKRNRMGFDRGYYYMGFFNYAIPTLSGWHVIFEDRWKQERREKQSNLFRQDWEEDSVQQVVLPSARHLANQQDLSNSWYSDNMYHANKLQFYSRYNQIDRDKGEYLSLEITLPATYTWVTEDYRRGGQQTKVTDHRWILQPELDFEYNTHQFRDRYSFSYQMNMQGPDLTQKVDYTDTSNPLRIMMGNPNLKPSHSHEFKFYLFNSLGGKRQDISFKTHAIIHRNLMAQGVDYNAATGAYTYKPVNVNGNWNSMSYVTYKCKLDKKKRFNLELRTQFDYFRSVDMKTSEHSGKAQHNKVDQYVPSESMKLSYSYSKWKVELMGQVHWNNIQPQDVADADIHSTDFNYGMNLVCELPWKLQFATDMKMYSRRGYSESSLNTDDFVWNAQLNRSLCKGKLNLGIKAYDLLHQISQTHATVNSQGRVETWQLALPNYVMLHLQWKFNKNPKKRK